MTTLEQSQHADLEHQHTEHSKNRDNRDNRDNNHNDEAEYWIDHLSQAVVLTYEGRIRRINAEATRLWGVSQERAAGRPVLEVIRRHTLENLLERGGELEIEMAGRTLHCVATRKNAYGSLVVEDITEHRRREAELREATAVLSHEFRTPVTALRGILEALEYDIPQELAQNFVQQGLQETERLARLVEDLAIGFRPTRARTLLLSEAYERAKRLLTAELRNKGLLLTFGEDYWVRADPDKLLQVLLNLIENAIKYGPEGKTIEVRTAIHSTWIEICVLDHGPAISDTEGLFRAHTRGRTATGQGSGMGLYIVRSIVQGWGGRTWVHRLEQQNAFCFTVPMAQAVS